MPGINLHFLKSPVYIVIVCLCLPLLNYILYCLYLTLLKSVFKPSIKRTSYKASLRKQSEARFGVWSYMQTECGELSNIKVLPKEYKNLYMLMSQLCIKKRVVVSEAYAIYLLIQNC